MAARCIALAAVGAGVAWLLLRRRRGARTPTAKLFTIPPTGISEAAHRFLEERPGGAAYLNPDGSVAYKLSTNGVAKLRAENTNSAAAGCQSVQKQLGIRLEDGLVGDTPVLWVIPPHVGGTDVILYMFGGAFVVGSPEDDLSISGRLATALCRRVCAPRYRRAPEHPFPAARDDVMAVYRALSADRECCGVLVAGESAGGNLALKLTLDVANASGLALPKAVALLSPWIDLTHGGDSHKTLAYVDPTLSVPRQLAPAARAYAGALSVGSPEISPLFAAMPSVSLPPTIICSATRDLLLSDSLRLASKLYTQATAVELRVTDGLWHVFEWYPDIPEATESIAAIAAFLAARLQPPSAVNE